MRKTPHKVWDSCARFTGRNKPLRQERAGIKNKGSIPKEIQQNMRYPAVARQGSLFFGRDTK